MTYLHIDSKAQPIVDRVLERAADENCEEDINLLFSVATWNDGDYTLISEEAKTVEELLDAQAGPRRIVLFGGCNDNGPVAPLYEQSHIATALKNALPSDQSDESIEVLLSLTNEIESHIIQSLMIDIISRNSNMYALLVVERPETRAFFQLINNISQFPNFDINILIRYLEEVWPPLEHGLWFNGQPDQLLGHLVGLEVSHYIENYYERMLLTATDLYQKYEHEQKYIPDIQSYCDDTDYLYTFVNETDNEYARAIALLCLAELGEGTERVMAEIETTAHSLNVTEKHYVTLNLINDPQTNTWLLDRLGKVNFLEQSILIDSLKFQTNNANLVSQIIERMDSPNAHEQARAFTVVASIMTTIPIEKREELFDRALVKAEDDKTPTIVRLAAFTVLGTKYNPDYAKNLENLTQHPDPEISAMANRTLQDVSRVTMGSHFTNERVDHVTQTAFFRNPRQLDWIFSATKHKATQWQPGDDPITILDVGGSYGAEAISILIFILDEYRKNPEDWGLFNPYENLRLVTTDIETRALVSSDATVFANRQDLNSSEFGPLELVTKLIGFEQDAYKAYFDISDDNVWTLKKSVRDMIETRYMDITDCDAYLETYGPSDIVVYNQVDPYLSPNQLVPASENVLALSKQFIATSPMRQETLDTLATQAQLSATAGGLMLFEKPETPAP
jgi:chemotaxis methyl-accepting protein methylase